MTRSQEYYQNTERMEEIVDQINIVRDRHLVVTEADSTEIAVLQTEHAKLAARQDEIISETNSAAKIYDVANMTCWSALQFESGEIERLAEVAAPVGVTLSLSGQYPRQGR